ncbi:MAG: IS110 family transposase [Propionibacteriaceae bacterium]|nr:IS110 family transposase [Propionibacteriaceae bacterium]
MSIMTHPPTVDHLVAGIDTHHDFHVVVVVDPLGRPLEQRRFDADPAGDQTAVGWLTGLGVGLAGVEGSASYGLGIARALHTAGIQVVEVTRPNRQDRRARGKSDPIDAHNAALAALNGTRTAPMKHDTDLDQLRIRHGLRNSAVTACTAVTNQIWSYWKRVYPTTPRPTSMTQTLAHQLAATDTPLAAAADRWLALTHEINTHTRWITSWITHHHPHLLQVPGMGPFCAATLLLTAGDNPERLTTEAAFARLCGVAPIPVSSGRNQHMRLHRGGHRQANRAIDIIAKQRRRWDPTSQTYLQRRIEQDHKKPKAALRCLKRAIAREIYKELRKSLDNL